MNSHTLSRDSWRILLSLALPISLQSLIQSSLGMIDQVMIGQLGEVSIAAVSLAGRPGFIVLFALFGVTTGTSIFASQFWGAGEINKLGKVMRATLISGLAVIIPFIALSLSVPEWLLGIFTTDSAVISAGIPYLRINAISFIALLLTLGNSSMLRSCGNASIPLWTGLGSVIINTVLNYVLIFGMFGFPRAGIAGSAVATVIARFIEAALLIFIMEAKKCPGTLRDAFRSRLDAAFLRIYAVTTLPVMLNELLWSIGDAAYAVIYGRMSTADLAAMTLTYPVQSLSIGFFTGLSGAAGIMLGNSLGANDFDAAKRLSNRFVYLGIAGCILTGVAIGILSLPYTSLYKVSAEVRNGAITLLIVFSLIMWVKVSNMIIGAGILRSGGQTGYTLMLDIVGTWIIGIPLGLFAAFVLHLNLPAVYILISIEEVFRLVMGLLRMKSGKWMRNLNIQAEELQAG